MIVSVLISLLILGCYIGMIIAKNGIPYSISETYYRINHKFLFPAVMLLSAFSLLPGALESSTENSQFLMFLGTVAMCIIGLAPDFVNGEKAERITHYVASAALFLCIQIWVGVNFPGHLFCWVAYVAYILLNIKNSDKSINLYDRFISLKPAFWAEMVIIFDTYLTVIIGLV